MKNKILPIIAVVILIAAVGAALYVDQEHIMRIGNVKVYFFKENREQSGIQNAAKRLAEAYEKRIKPAA